MDITFEPEGTLGLEIKYKRSIKLADSICDWAYDVEKSGSAKYRKSVKPLTFGGPPPNPAAGFLVCHFGNVLAVNHLPLVRKLHLLETFSLLLMSPYNVYPAFVFNDLVLLAQSKSPSDDDPLWVLIRDVSVIKPLSIAQISAQNPGGIQSVSLCIWTSCL